MVDVRTSILIARPREEVARFAADPANALRWYTNITASRPRMPGPLAEGSEVEFEARFLGRTLRYTYVVAAFEPGRRLVMRTASGPFEMATTYEWESLGDNVTRMTLRNAGAPAGFSRLVAPFVDLAMRRENRKDLARLKRLLEAAEDGRERD